jgi:tripeptidyl-peptidase-1
MFFGLATSVSVKMLVLSIASLLALTATVQSAAVPQTHAIHEKRDIISTQWIKRQKLGSLDVLPIRIGLRQKNLHRGHEFLMDVSASALLDSLPMF